MHVEDPSEIFNLAMARDGEDYADPFMKMVIVKTTSGDEAGVEAVEEDAETYWSRNANVVSGAADADLRNSVMYNLKFDHETWMTMFTIKFEEAGYYAFFCEHYLSEFKYDKMDNVLTDSHGDAVTFDWESSVKEEDPKKWGDVIGATILVWIVTLVGLLVIALPSHLGITPIALIGKDGLGPTLLRYFASGALLSLATSLILFEATHLITEGYDNEVDALWRWSVMILLGFMTSPICHVILLTGMKFAGVQASTPVPTASATDDETPSIEMGATPSAAEAKAENAKAKGVSTEEVGLVPFVTDNNVSIVAGLLFGDFFHNFADGIFIGAAFKLCDTSLAWTITWATVAHELPQEISDFTVLVNECGYTTLQAILYNVLSGISVLFGGLAVTGSDIDNYSVGMLLAYGGGAIVYIACTELFPRGEETDMTADPDSYMKRILGLLSFVFGCIVVSLVLLDHEHCSGEEEGGSHEAH